MFGEHVLRWPAGKTAAANTTACPTNNYAVGCITTVAIRATTNITSTHSATNSNYNTNAVSSD